MNDSYRNFPHLLGVDEATYKSGLDMCEQADPFPYFRQLLTRGLAQDKEAKWQAEQQDAVNKKIEELLGTNGNIKIHTKLPPKEFFNLQASPPPSPSSPSPPLPLPPAPPTPVLELNEINFPWLNQLDEKNRRVPVPSWMLYIHKWQLAWEIKQSGYSGQGMTDPMKAMAWVEMAAQDFSDWNELDIKGAKFWMALRSHYMIYKTKK